MITSEFCKQYVKRRLGVPVTPFELSEEELDFWLNYTVMEFSKYIPRRITVNLRIEQSKTEEENLFLIPLDEDILNVTNVWTKHSSGIIAGHPLRVFPSSNYEELESFFIKTDLVNTSTKYSFLFFTYEFVPPDKIRITPTFSETYLLELEVYHKRDLTSIPVEFSTIFMKMFLKNVALTIAGIRSMYNRISTTIGEIELNPDYLENLVDQIDEEIKETLENFNPGVMMIRG